MPQLQPGQLVPGQDGAPKLYGVDKVENTVPFQEKLMRLFKPQEFVTIKNIDDEAVYWQYMPADSETENMSEDGMQRQIYREQPEMWVIQPGETEVVVGASAYRALDVMYKAWTAKSTLRKFKDPTNPQFNEKNEHLPKNFNFADAGAQDTFIALAYVGKAMPSFGPQQPTVPAADNSAGTDAVTQPTAPQPAVGPTAAPQVDDPTIPKPKTTEGAPLRPPEYADPNAEAISRAKELANAGSPEK